MGTELDRIWEHPLLPPEEEKDLIKKAQAGDRRAWNRVLRCNQRLVGSIAKRYQNRGFTLDELQAEGNIGLVRALEKFDADRGLKFSTYAVWWIRQAITRAIQQKAEAIRIPVHLCDKRAAIRRKQRESVDETGVTLSWEDAAKETGLSDKQIQALKDSTIRIRSLHDPVGHFRNESDGSELGDLLPDPNSDTFELVEHMQRKQECLSLLKRLNPREQKVLRLRYGIDGQPLTYSQIEPFLGVSRTAIQNIEKKAIKKLRKLSGCPPVDPVKVTKQEKIRKLKDQGLGIREIARRLDCSPKQVTKSLSPSSLKRQGRGKKETPTTGDNDMEPEPARPIEDLLIEILRRREELDPSLFQQRKQRILDQIRELKSDLAQIQSLERLALETIAVNSREQFEKSEKGKRLLSEEQKNRILELNNQGIPKEAIASQVGVSLTSVQRWVRRLSVFEGDINA